MTQNQKCYYFTLLTHKQTLQVIKVINRSAVGTYIVYRVYAGVRQAYICLNIINFYLSSLTTSRL